MKKYLALALVALAAFTTIVLTNRQHVTIPKQTIDSNSKTSIEHKFVSEEKTNSQLIIGTSSVNNKSEIVTRSATKDETLMDGSDDFHFISLNNVIFSNLSINDEFDIPISDFPANTTATVMDVALESNRKVYTGTLENPQSTESGEFFLSIENGIILASFFIDGTEYSLNTYQSYTDMSDGYIYEPGKRFNQPDAVH